jgi:uncharacterized YkwD family protein
MKRKSLVLAAVLSLVFTASCTPRQQQYYNNQRPNPGLTTGQNTQPSGSTESSISAMDVIKRVKIVSDKTNIRAGCSNTTSVLQTSTKNSTLDVVSQVGDWFAVKLPNNQIGFVPKQQAKPIVVEDKQPEIKPEVSQAVPQTTQTPSPNATTAPKTPTAQANSTAMTAQEQEMLRLVNQARAQNNVAPLQADMQVCSVARVKSQDMIDNNYFSHNSPKYGSPFDMMKAFNINYVQAGENIAGNQNVQAAHNALMNSPGHRKNILNPEFTHIGIGIKQGGSYGNMFTQMFVSKPK